jgi:hypothetical protein
VRIPSGRWRALLFAIALVVICIPRFDRTDIGIDSLTTLGESAASRQGDARHYVALVRYFRGEPVRHELRAPFSHRPLAPWLASRLPFRPLTSLDLVNVGALIACLAFLSATLTRLRARPRTLAIGQALFVFSFPTFYYGSIGYVDPVLLCALAATLHLLLVRRRGLAFLVFVLGCGVKESMFLMAPVLVADAWRSPRARRRLAIGRALAAVLAGCALLVVLGCALPDPTHGIQLASLEKLLMNVRRTQAWASLLLSFGAPGLLGLGLALRPARRRAVRRHPHGLPLVAGAASAVCLALYAFPAAYADGRFIWMMYPFVIPLVAIMMDENAVTVRDAEGAAALSRGEPRGRPGRA